MVVHQSYCFGPLSPRHNWEHFAETFSNAFSSMRVSCFDSFFPKGPIYNKSALVPWWLYSEQATSHQPDQCWTIWLMHVCVTWRKRVKPTKISWMDWASRSFCDSISDKSETSTSKFVMRKYIALEMITLCSNFIWKTNWWMKATRSLLM